MRARDYWWATVILLTASMLALNNINSMGLFIMAFIMMIAYFKQNRKEREYQEQRRQEREQRRQEIQMRNNFSSMLDVGSTLMEVLSPLFKIEEERPKPRIKRRK